MAPVLCLFQPRSREIPVDKPSSAATWHRGVPRIAPSAPAPGERLIPATDPRLWKREQHLPQLRSCQTQPAQHPEHKPIPLRLPPLPFPPPPPPAPAGAIPVLPSPVRPFQLRSHRRSFPNEAEKTHFQFTSKSSPATGFFSSSITFKILLHLPTGLKGTFHKIILLPRLLPPMNPARSPEAEQGEIPSPSTLQLPVLLGKIPVFAASLAAQPGRRHSFRRNTLPAAAANLPGHGSPREASPGAGNAGTASLHPSEHSAQEAASTAWLFLQIKKKNPRRKDPDSYQAPFPAHPGANGRGIP